MLVEPESLYWLTGRMVLRRDGATWAEEFARFPALKAIVRDDGTGLGKGLKLERDRRRATNLSDLNDTLDVFHRDSASEPPTGERNTFSNAQLTGNPENYGLFYL